MLDANCVVMMRPLCPSTLCIIDSLMVDSLMVRPGESTLVESLIISVTPSLPTRSHAARSKCRPSTGCSSIFQSPVCTIVPAEHRKIRPQQSGMECVTRTASISKGPAGNRSPMSITLKRLPSPHRLNSFIRRWINCMVKCPAYTGVAGSSAGITQGRAPMWSSCPCVMSTASILSFHRDKKETSGRTFWMPSSSWSGNMSPASSRT
mmetsp:Transcript_46017/g.73667  ORF Transcript_46017/g.73667 Transcript_46017/m.73667 type:complete len:207 (-) Transcript_46017:711-1331(-)